MFKRLATLQQKEKDLAFGYFRLHCNKYAPLEVRQLLMLYLFILDEFDTNLSYTTNVKISGLNNTICESILSGSISMAVGQNAIAISNKTQNNYHHWKFKLMKTSSPNDPHEICIGITCDKWKNQHMVQDIAPRFYTKNDTIIDMYLDLNKRNLIVITNNRCVDIVLDTKNTMVSGKSAIYRMVISINNIHSIIELISYHNSAFYNLSINNSIINHIGYARSILNLDEKLKHYDIVLGSYPNMTEIHTEYINRLVFADRFREIFEFISKYNIHKLSTEIHFPAIIDALYGNDEAEKLIKIVEMIDYKDIKFETYWLKCDKLFEIAYCYCEIQEYVSSVKYYNIHIDNHILDVTAVANLGNIYYGDMEQFENALKCYLKLSPDVINTRNLESKIAHCYADQNDFENALKYDKLRLNKNPNDPESYVQVAETYKLMNDDDKTDEYFKKALNLPKSSTHFRAHYQYAKFLGDKCIDIAKAQEYYFKAMKLANNDGDRAESCLHIGILYNKLNLKDKCQEWFKKIEKYNLDNLDTACNNLGYYFLIEKHYNLSYKYLKKALIINQNRVLTTGNLANCLCEMNKYNEAIPYLKEALSRPRDRIHPDVGPKCLYNYSFILFNKNNYNKSINLCNELINRNDFNKFKNKDKVYYLMSRNLFQTNKLKKSLEYCQKAIDENSSNIEYKQMLRKIKDKHDKSNKYNMNIV